MSEPKFYFVFDVESVGLHGEGFAVGFVIVDLEGNKLEEGRYACPSGAARGNQGGHEWCSDNIPKFTISHDAPWLVRNAFWRRWSEWKEKGAVLLADCAWPVEARFLAACVDDKPMDREWMGPYPLYDLSSVLLAHGIDPLKTNERLADELPIHDPLADAKQSTRLLLMALGKTP